MTLRAELGAFRSEFMFKVPPEIREAMTSAEMELAASGITQRAIKAGDRAPDFRLPDARGGRVDLRGLLAKGAVVVSFYRGGWCPYCNLELHGLKNGLPEIQQLGHNSWPARRKARMRASQPPKRTNSHSLFLAIYVR